MPQLISPGNPIAMGIEAGTIAALIELFGFEAQKAAGFAAGVNLQVLLLTAALEFAWTTYLPPIKGSCKGCNKNAKVHPLMNAVTTATAFGVAEYFSNVAVNAGDLFLVFCVTYIWNTYVSNYWGSMVGLAEEIKQDIQSII